MAQSSLYTTPESKCIIEMKCWDVANYSARVPCMCDLVEPSLKSPSSHTPPADEAVDIAYSILLCLL